MNQGILIAIINLMFFGASLGALCTLQINEAASLDPRIVVDKNVSQISLTSKWSADLVNIQYQVRFDHQDKSIYRYNGTMCEKDESDGYKTAMAEAVEEITGISRCTAFKKGENVFGAPVTDVSCNNAPEIIEIAQQPNKVAITVISGYSIRLSEFTGSMKVLA